MSLQQLLSSTAELPQVQPYALNLRQPDPTDVAPLARNPERRRQATENPRPLGRSTIIIPNSSSSSPGQNPLNSSYFLPDDADLADNLARKQTRSVPF